VRIVLVANAASGSSGGGTQAADLLRASGAVVTELPLDRFCDGPGGIREDAIAELAPALDADRVVVAGGDGSIGPAAVLALRAGLPLAVLAAGTANSFARWAGLPLELEEAAALAASPDPALRPMEVAHAGGRPFVNVASAGLAVLAGEHAHDLKPRLGPLAYAVGALRSAMHGRPMDLEVEIDGDRAWSGRAWQVMVAATGAFGGDAGTGGVDPADARLDVAVVKAGSRLALVRRGLAMRRRELVHEDEVVHLRGRDVRLGVRDGTSFNVDGEILRTSPPEFGVLGVLDVVARAGAG
jgi:diacylglycerol kinase family enzyme